MAGRTVISVLKPTFFRTEVIPIRSRRRTLLTVTDTAPQCFGRKLSDTVSLVRPPRGTEAVCTNGSSSSKGADTV